MVVLTEMLFLHQLLHSGFVILSHALIVNQTAEFVSLGSGGLEKSRNKADFVLRKDLSFWCFTVTESILYLTLQMIIKKLGYRLFVSMTHLEEMLSSSVGICTPVRKQGQPLREALGRNWLMAL